MSYEKFKQTVWEFYTHNGRTHLPWRNTRDPYKILVSEIMLQQTQVDRVIPKYANFLKKFPTIHALAEAKNKDVLLEWQGLGHNRRALALKGTAEIVAKTHTGIFPRTYDDLIALPGIGPATAGDILAFAYNEPSVVIETNIRTVYIHHFFKHTENISDKDITRLVEKTLDARNPRDWYYALMDYGTYLKKEFGNNTTKSAQYKKQSTFKGSNREVRSHILKSILTESKTEAELMKLLNTPKDIIQKNLIAMQREGLIHVKKGRISA